MRELTTNMPFIALARMNRLLTCEYSRQTDRVAWTLYFRLLAILFASQISRFSTATTAHETGADVVPC